MSSETGQFKNIKKYLSIFLKGMAMGAADSVPGVSGGTIAVITRIYDELIYSIRAVDTRALRLLFSEGPGRAWDSINGYFLLVLACGIFFSLRLSAGIVLNLLENNFEALMAFFSGLIIASGWSLKSEVGSWGISTVLLFLVGMALTLLISGLTPYRAEISYAYLFLCGAVAICAMILPGLSGAFLLLVMGVYDFMLGALVDVEIITISVFAAGCLTGLLAFARLLTWALSHYREASYTLLTGMLVASVYILWPWQQKDLHNTGGGGAPLVAQAHNVWPTDYQILTGNDPHLLAVLVSFLTGVILIIVFDKLFRKSAD